MRTQTPKTRGLDYTTQWKTFVLSPNKFLTRPRAYYTQRVAGSVPDLFIVSIIKSEDRLQFGVDCLDDSPYNTKIATR